MTDYLNHETSIWWVLLLLKLVEALLYGGKIVLI